MPFKDKKRKREWANEYYHKTKNLPHVKKRVAEHSKRYIQNHLEKVYERARIYKKNNPHKVRKWYLKSHYGISEETYNILMDTQNNLCAICNEPEIAKNKRLHVDHNHITKKVRGLLCGRCNTAIGLLRENINLLVNATNYLNKHNG